MTDPDRKPDNIEPALGWLTVYQAVKQSPESSESLIRAWLGAGADDDDIAIERLWSCVNGLSALLVGGFYGQGLSDAKIVEVIQTAAVMIAGGGLDSE